MRKIPPDKLEDGRFVNGSYASKRGAMHGAFYVIGPHGQELAIMSSGVGRGNEGWEHVSVSTSRRTPNWTEMCFVKDLFWEPHECVIQYHPPIEEYVNCHPYCLHLWRPNDGKIPLPPSIFVGPKT